MASERRADKYELVNQEVKHLVESHKSFMVDAADFRKRIESKLDSIIDNWHQISEKVALDHQHVETIDREFADLKTLISEHIDSTGKANDEIWDDLNQVESMIAEKVDPIHKNIADLRVEMARRLTLYGSLGGVLGGVLIKGIEWAWSLIHLATSAK